MGNALKIAARDSSEAVDELERLLKEGKAAAARAKITALRRGRVPRELLAPLAQLAWRAGIPEQGLRLLGKCVRPPDGSPSNATGPELLEYAACLCKAGSFQEALPILDGIDPDRFPRAHFYRAFPYIYSWNYEAAIPLLERYLRSPSLTPYDVLVGKVNLAEALLFVGRGKKADYLLRELLRTASQRKLTLLLSRVLELSAERFIAGKDWTHASRFLAESRKQTSDRGSYENLVMEKLEALMALREKREGAIARMEAVRAKALRLMRTETVRDCDLALAIHRGDPAAVWGVYFSTPYLHYRSRLLRWAGLDGGSVPPSVEITLVPGAHGPCLDVESAGVEPSAASLGRGSLLHKLLVALSTDLYRPQRLPALHGMVFPGEKYNADSSPRRLHEAIRRLRQALADAAVPLDVLEENGYYRLEATGPMKLRLGGRQNAARRYGAEIAELRRFFGLAPFRIQDALDALGCPRRTVHRILSTLLETRELSKSGRAVSTTYRFPK